MDFIKVKDFCVSNETQQKSEKTTHKIGWNVETPISDKENPVSDKGLASSMYKQYLQLNKI